MHKKIKISEKELETITGGHERTTMYDNGQGQWVCFICSHCGEKCFIANCEHTERWEGCSTVISAKCDKCGTWDDIHG